jgi:outer membrane lipoprotein SlyB
MLKLLIDLTLHHRPMRPITFAAAVVFALLACPAAAQSIAPGVEVRVELSTPPGETLEGDVAGITSDSIFIAGSERGDVRIARETVIALYVAHRENESASAAIGALTGAPLGMLAGALVGSALAKPGAGHRVVGGALGAVAGLLVGATAGGMAGHHDPGITWFRVDWPTDLRP